MEHNKNFKIISKNRHKLRDLLPLEKPFSLFIEPTNMCNFKCKPCAHGQEKNREDLKPFMHFDYDLYVRLINELKEWKGPKLKLLRLTALGEPFMNPRMCDMIRLAKEADIAERVDLFTNGSLLTEEICEQLVDIGLDYIRISIYSVLPDRHKDVTRSSISIEKIRANVENLYRIREEKGQTKPYMLAKMFETYSFENDVYKAMYKDIVDEVGFEKVHDATQYNDADLIGDFYQDEEKTRRTKEEFKRSLNDIQTCPRPFMALVLCANGDVVMCTHDAPRATRVANVKEQSLQEIWNGKELYQFRKMLLTGNKDKNRLCKHCEWYRLFPEEDNVDGFPLEKLPGGKSDD